MEACGNPISDSEVTLAVSSDIGDVLCTNRTCLPGDRTLTLENEVGGMPRIVAADALQDYDGTDRSADWGHAQTTVTRGWLTWIGRWRRADGGRRTRRNRSRRPDRLTTRSHR